MPPSPRTRLLVGGDAQSRIAAVGSWLDENDGEVLLLAPSAVAADDLLRAAVLRRGARFGSYRLTLDRLAAVLAAPRLARAGRAPATGLALEAVCARVAHLAAGALSYFAPVADKPGFPKALARTLSELRMNDVSLERLRALGAGGADLAQLAENLASELGRTALADRADIYAAAVAAAREDASPPIGLPLVLCDLALTSAREAALVAALARRAPAILATVPAGDERTERLAALALDARPERMDIAGTNALSALKRHLFSDGCGGLDSLDESVRLAAWPGEARECLEIARGIQAEAARGVPFDRMAVLLHGSADHAAHLEEALRRADIPAYFARGTTRPHPAGRALLALLACAAEGLSARRFAEYLSLAQVPEPGQAGRWMPPRDDLVPTAPLDLPEASSGAAETWPDPEARPVIEGSLRAPWRWEQLLVDAAVIGGRDRWARRLDGLLEELERRRTEAIRDEVERADAIATAIADLAHLRAFALPLVERLAALPPKATWGQWLQALSDLALAALREPDPVLATLAELDPMAPVGPVDLDEVQRVLAPRLRELPCDPPRRRYGAVFVGPTEVARGLAFDVVFVPGLAERIFPRKISEDPLLLDALRADLGDLVDQRDRAAAERLALRVAVGAARERVSLSYPRLDVEQGRPRVPSFYALEVLRAVEGDVPGFAELGERAFVPSGGRLGWPAPDRPADAVDDAEYDLALLGPRIDAPPADVAGAAAYLLGANPHLARALRARARRWLRRWTPADGLVDPDESARAALARHQLAARSYSPTALQNFAICPYRFLLQAIHRLQVREEPAPLEAIDPLTRGALFHAVQFEVLTRLSARGLLPVRAPNLATALDVIDEALGEIAGRFEDDLAPAIPRVWQDGIQSIRADLREWLRRQAAPGPWVPWRFELAFGLAGRQREQADPESRPEPVLVAGGLLLRGSIDLVERNDSGLLRVTDHKTGKVYAPETIVVHQGEMLQPLLYALACEALTGGTVTEGRLYYCTADGGYTVRSVPLDEASRAAATQVVAILNRALRDGFLPAAPRKDACQRCDYRPVCGPNEERRVRRKPPDRLEDLARLRGMP